jgi:hypothetical protein
MTTFCAFFLWWLIPVPAPLPPPLARIDSLQHQLEVSSRDSTRALLLADLAFE